MSIRRVIEMLLVMLTLCGCGSTAPNGAGGSPKAAVQPAPKQAGALPEWAPRSPSPEFLRAARTLRPFSDARDWGPDVVSAASRRRLQSVLVPAWELFGTLTDAQLRRFMRTKQVRIPCRALTQEQRAALDRFFDLWRQTMKGLPQDGEWSPDVLVELYKLGAREDLSNVTLTYLHRGSGIVAMILYVRQSNGKELPSPLGIGRL